MGEGWSEVGVRPEMLFANKRPLSCRFSSLLRFRLELPCRGLGPLSLFPVRNISLSNTPSPSDCHINLSASFRHSRSVAPSSFHGQIQLPIPAQPPSHCFIPQQRYQFNQILYGFYFNFIWCPLNTPFL